jgi:hypothetical protein
VCPYFDRLVEVAPDPGAIKRWLTIPVLHDLDTRLAMMEEFGADYRQILTLSMPALESVAGPDQTPVLARACQRLDGESRRPAAGAVSRLVFGSDCPFDPEGGPLFIREIIAAIDSLEIPEADRRKIYEDNIRRLARHRLRLLQ